MAVTMALFPVWRSTLIPPGDMHVGQKYLSCLPSTKYVTLLHVTLSQAARRVCAGPVGGVGHHHWQGNVDKFVDISPLNGKLYTFRFFEICQTCTRQDLEFFLLGTYDI